MWAMQYGTSIIDAGMFVVPALVIVARVGLYSAVLDRKSLALAGGRNRRRSKNSVAPFGRLLWSFSN